MTGSKALGTLKWLSRSCNWAGVLDPPRQCLPKYLSRSMVTTTQVHSDTYSRDFLNAHVSSAPPVTNDIPTPTWDSPPAIATLYDFHTMEPLQFLEYKNEQLLLPLRRDILHRAIVYEGDMTRQGTASTKWRDDVRGSRKKIRPQKGTGRARLGDKKSPMLRGGGVAFGPHPRDFSTELPRQIYDKAWRTALSFRYRRGQLVIVDNNISIPEGASVHYLKQIFTRHGWGARFGRSLLITDVKEAKLFKTMAQIGEDARVLDREDVDVKDLLETGRLIIEQRALDQMLARHSSDLKKAPRVA